MVVPGGIVVKNEVYSQPFKEIGDPELDCVTEYCLKILYCSGSILLHHQLKTNFLVANFIALHLK